MKDSRYHQVFTRWVGSVVFCFWVFSLSGQTTILNTRLSADYKDALLEDILDDISEKTGIEFSYSASKIPSREKISATFQEPPLSDVLDELFIYLPIKYELMDDYIILKKGPVRAQIEEAASPSYTLNGYIKDSQSGELLIGATAYVPELMLGCVSNSYGYYSLTLPQGNYTLMLSYIGFDILSKEIDLKSNMKVDFGLVPGIEMMDEVIITSVDREELLFKKVASQSQVLPEQIKIQPALFGESDILKSLESQAGINYFGDASSYFHVRGGHYDQNLILLDEATLFNPSHLLGIFSPIIPDAVKSVDIYKSAFPAQYGGRLSSVIDIRTRDGNMNEYEVDGSIGIIASRMSIQGPMKKGRSSYMVSLRRSYFDAFLKPLAPDLDHLYFSDFSTKFNIRLGARDRLFITLYRGKDIFQQQEGTSGFNGIDWSNTSSTFRWNHVFGSNLFLNTTFYASKYDYFLRNSGADNSYWNSRINNATIKQDLSHYVNPSLKLRYGYQAGIYNFNPGNYSSESTRDNYQVSPVKSLEVAVFMGIEQEIYSRVALNYGLRLARWSNYGESTVIKYDEHYEALEAEFYTENELFYNRYGLEPRVAASIKLSPTTFFKSSYSRTLQYLNLISNSISPFNSFEVWLPAGPNIKPQKADIIDFGIIRELREGSLSVQANIYYKWMHNQIGYAYHANMLVNPLLEGEIRQGEGRAYGAEISIQKNAGKLQGQLAYTYSRSFLTIADLSGGREFPALQDRPHALNISMSYHVKPKWLINGNVTIVSGGRISTPTSFYYYQGYQVPVFTEQNNDCLPANRRFDISSTFLLNKADDKYKHKLVLAIYNFFAVKNPSFLYFNKIEKEDGRLIVPADRSRSNEITPSIRYTYLLIPSLTYQFSF